MLLVLIATALTPAVVAIAVLAFVEQWLVMAGAFAVAVGALVSVMGVIKGMLD